MTERKKLAAALDIFTELNMPRERDAVRAELESMRLTNHTYHFAAEFAEVGR